MTRPVTFQCFLGGPFEDQRNFPGQKSVGAHEASSPSYPDTRDGFSDIDRRLNLFDG